jgi:hypothetical protein
MRRTRRVAAVLSVLPPLLLPLLLAPLASADVAVGDVITPANREKVKDLLPEDLYAYAVQNFEGLNITIAPTGDYTPHPRYVEATTKYACQASLDEKGNLVNYTAGQPFPYSEWAKEATGHACDLKRDDPRFALKLAWDVNYRWQGPGHNYPHWGFSYMRNEGKKLWRLGQGVYRRTYFSHRADLLPERDELDPGTDVEWAEFFEIMDPFDLRGTMYLLYRYTDPAKEDDTWAYIPSLRRVRRVAATQKSDSLMGTEFTLEDFALFSGYVTAQDWEFGGESEGIAAMSTRRQCFPLNMGEDVARRLEGMERLGTLDEWQTCHFGPYGALPFVEERWEKRTMFRLDDYPQQKGHPYSLKKIWYDKETMAPKYAFAYDRAGEPYKILVTVHQWSEDSPNPINRDLRAPIEVVNTVVNLQNLNSHVIQMFNANMASFSASESLKYFNTSRLKLGR